MNGIVILTENYTYEGNIFNKHPHGHGKFQYANGDKYIGHCHLGKPDGFGKYIYVNGSTYVGFFTAGKFSGVGTFEDNKNIYKGTWRNDNRHGSFYKTNKITFQSFKQLWIKGKLMSNIPIQYIPPVALQTTKDNPLKKPKVYQTAFKGVEKLCMACMENPTNATNIRCGHVVMCHQCLSRVSKCPVCRAPIQNILKLFVS